MKTALFATTALVAASVATVATAGDVSLSLGGGITVGVAVGEYSDGGFPANVENDFHLIRDGEIHFRGQGVLDNGIEIVTRVELEAHTDGDQIDENWVQVKSQFGTLLIGGDDDAADNVAGGTGITGFGIGGGAWDPSYDVIAAQIDSIGGSDDIQIGYYSPTIFGLTVGVSYQPRTSDGAGPGGDETVDSDSGNEGDELDRISIGARYENSFEGFDFEIGGGFITTNGGNDGAEDERSFSVGAEIGFAGFGVQGRYENSDFSSVPAAAVEEVDRFGGGITYATGPWSFGAAIAFQTEEDADGDERDEFVVGGGAAYELGNGVEVGGQVFYGDVDDDDQEDVDGFGAAILLGIDF